MKIECQNHVNIQLHGVLHSRGGRAASNWVALKLQRWVRTITAVIQFSLCGNWSFYYKGNSCSAFVFGGYSERETQSNAKSHLLQGRALAAK